MLCLEILAVLVAAIAAILSYFVLRRELKDKRS